MANVTHQRIQRASGLRNATFVGIDTALRKTGVCVLTETAVDLFLIDTKKLRGAARLAYVGDELRRTLSSLDNVTLGAVENGAYKAGGRLFQLGQVQGIAQLEMYRSGLDMIGVSPSRLKKFFANHGNASKDKMVERADAVLGTLGLDDNMADAYALANLAETYYTETPRTRKQAEVLLDITVESVP